MFFAPICGYCHTAATEQHLPMKSSAHDATMAPSMPPSRTSRCCVTVSAYLHTTRQSAHIAPIWYQSCCNGALKIAQLSKLAVSSQCENGQKKYREYHTGKRCCNAIRVTSQTGDVGSKDCWIDRFTVLYNCFSMITSSWITHATDSN